MKILVTGGNSGLGKATVELLAKEGHKIYFSFLPNEQCTREANEMVEMDNDLTALPLNFCEPESVESFCEFIKTLEIDVLINSAYAGRAQGKRFHQTLAEDYLTAFKNNSIPTIKITQACIEGMRKRKFGKIINIIT